MKLCNTLFAGGLLLFASISSGEDLLSLYARHPSSLGARAAGLGQVGLAMVDDGSAALWNPANLSWLRRTEISGSILRGSSRITSRYQLDGRDTDADLAYVKLDHLSATYPVPVYRGSLVWAFGYARLRDFDRQESIRAATLQDELDDTGASTVYYAALAGQVSRTFHAGLTLMYHRDEYESLFSRYEERSLFIRELDKLEMSGIGVRLGGCFTPGGPLRISGVIQPPIKLDVEWSRKLVEGPDSPGLYGNNYGIRLPLELGLGISWRERFWQVGASWTWQDWATAEYTDLPAGMAQVLSNMAIEKGYQGTHLIACGGEYSIPDTDLMLRTGIWYRTLPFSDSVIQRADEDTYYSYWNYESESPHWGFGLGAGYLFDQVLALQLSVNWEDMEYSYLDPTWEDEDYYRITTGDTRVTVRLAVQYRM